MDGSGGQVVEINLHIHLWNRCNITKFKFFFCNNLKAAISFMDCFMLRTVSSGLSIVSWHHDWGLGFLKFKYEALFSFVLHPQLSVRAVLQHPNISSLFREDLSSRAKISWHD
jgi:hypothetical protein